VALTQLHQLRISQRLIAMSKVIVSKDRILKNRNDHLQALLGRIKELLDEDEILIIATQETFKAPPKKTAAEETLANYAYINYGGHHFATTDAATIRTGAITFTGTNGWMDQVVTVPNIPLRTITATDWNTHTLDDGTGGRQE
jgi:hypothetical protein